MKIYVMEGSFTGEALHTEHFIRNLDFFLGILVFDFPPHHQFDHGLFVDVPRFMRFDYVAVAQDGDIVRNLENFIHLVRDVNDTRPALLQLFDFFKQPFHLFGGDCRGRLVHDDDIRVEGYRFQDFNHLDIRNIQAAQLRIRRVGKPFLLKELHRFFAYRLPVDRALALHGPMPEADVFLESKVRHKRQFLVDHGDSKIPRMQRIADFDLLAIHENIALVFLVNSIDDFHQGGFPRPVFAAQYVGRTAAELEAHIV
ncbi:MAG: hypothetical protein DELT_03327 [Desulfovibrio sp.]